MKSGNAKYLELVERRMELIRRLIRMGSDWRKAFIELKMEESERCAAEEGILCQQIHALDLQISNFGTLPSKPPSSKPTGQETITSKPLEVEPTIQLHIFAALERMATLNLELKHSNELRDAILRRSKVTIRALRNLFNSYAPTYAAPAASSTGTIYEESV